MMLEIGSQAPEFTLPDHNGEPVSLSDFRGQTVVLYFYPKDSTPGCTRQARAFADVHEELRALGAVVLGVSRDSSASHLRFIQKNGLPFRLLSDPERTALEAYGVWQEKKLYGKVSMGIVRTTYLIDGAGIIRAVMPKVKPDQNPADVLALLRAGGTDILAAPQLLERLTRTNLEQTPGYAVDGHCQRARDLIRAACAAPQAEVEFLVGGTQANQTVISAALRPYQGALCAQTGHINVHETGAIEATGHKVLPLPSQDGKITPKQVEQFCAVHWADPTREHIVQPGMVYLSQPTETGLLYTRTELEGFRAVCDRYGMYLYIDGARCGYGLAAPENDVDLTDLARLTDVFYIGGTKVGALFGEAVVISSPALQRDFRYCIKRHGGMLAKGRLLGLQFEALFEDGLYLQLGRHGVEQALRIREACLRRGLPLHFDSRTNQQFPVLTRAQRERLEEKYAFTFWEQLDDDRAVVRFCASWATDPAAVDALTADLLSLP